MDGRRLQDRRRDRGAARGVSWASRVVRRGGGAGDGDAGAGGVVAGVAGSVVLKAVERFRRYSPVKLPTPHERLGSMWKTTHGGSGREKNVSDGPSKLTVSL